MTSNSAAALVFLRLVLADGPRTASGIYADPRRGALTLKQIRYARGKLRVRVIREGFGRGSRVWWALPGQAVAPSVATTAQRPSRSGRTAEPETQACVACGLIKPVTAFPLNPVWRPGRPTSHVKCFACPPGLIISRPEAVEVPAP